MRSLPIEIIVRSGLSLLTLASVAQAAEPGQADFDSCNKEAYTQAASPSAAPAAGVDVTKPGTPVSPRAAPTTETPSTPSPSAPAGADRATRPGTPVAPSAETRTPVPGASSYRRTSLAGWPPRAKPIRPSGARLRRVYEATGLRRLLAARSREFPYSGRGISSS
jgi:hypothetical protein